MILFKSHSCSSDDERRVKIPVNDQINQGIVLTNLVFLCVDLACEKLVKVDIRARRRLRPQVLNVQLLLEAVGEAHDHVETVAVEHLEHEQVGTIRRVTQRDRAPQDALIVQVGRVDQVFDLVALVFGAHRHCRLEHLDEEFCLWARLVLFIHEQLELLLVILKASD